MAFKSGWVDGCIWHLFDKGILEGFRFSDK